MDNSELFSRFEAGQGAALGLGQALETTLRHKKVFGADISSLESARGRLTEMLHTLRRQLDEPAYRIAAVGGFSGGKSSLLNTLLERTLLSEDQNPETANVTVIRRAPDGGDETLTVRYMDEAQFRRYSQESCSEIGIEYDGEVGKMLEIAEKHRDGLRTQQQSALGDDGTLNDKIKGTEDLIELLSGYQQNRELLGKAEAAILTEETLRGWTTKTGGHSRGQLALVREVELKIHSNFLDEHTVLVDLPGSDSTRVRDTRIAHDYIKEVDAVIVCTLATRPFSREDTKVLSLLRAQGAGLKNKLFFVLTQFDRISIEGVPSLERTYQNALASLNDGFQIGVPDHFYVVSAYVARALNVESRGESPAPGPAGALREFREQADALQGGNIADLDKNVRDLLTVYGQGGGVPALRTALTTHFMERSMQTKMADMAGRLRAVHGEIDKLVGPRFKDLQGRATNVRDSAILAASAVTNACVRFVKEDIRQRIRNEDLSRSRCSDKFDECVTNRIDEAIRECLEQFDFLRELGDDSFGPQRLPELVGERVQERFFALLDTFLEEAAFRPIERLLTETSLPIESTMPALEHLGGNLTLETCVTKLYRDGTKPMEAYNAAKSSYRWTVAVCLRARAAEDIRGFSGGLPVLQLVDGVMPNPQTIDNYRNQLIQSCEFNYRGLAQGLCNKARDYVLYCIKLFTDQLIEMLPAERYAGEPDLVLDVDALLQLGDGDGAEVLGELDAELRSAMDGIETLSPSGSA